MSFVIKMKTIELVGNIANGENWVSDHWSKILRVHEESFPILRQMFKGTLNINLSDTPSSFPPDDDQHRLKAMELGHSDRWKSDIDGQLLRNGNYIHPSIKVLEISGVKIDGVLYFPGPNLSSEPNGSLPKVARNRLEVIAPIPIRERLQKRTVCLERPVSVRLRMDV